VQEIGGRFFPQLMRLFFAATLSLSGALSRYSLNG
jgi:hypothetical protein